MLLKTKSELDEVRLATGEQARTTAAGAQAPGAVTALRPSALRAVRYLGGHKVVLAVLLLVACGEGIFHFAVRAAHSGTLLAEIFPGFVIALFLSSVFTALMRDFAVRKSMVDSVRSVRKVHVKAVPRLGGVAFVSAWHLSIGLMLAVDARLRHLIDAKAPRAYIFLPGGAV